MPSAGNDHSGKISHRDETVSTTALQLPSGQLVPTGPGEAAAAFVAAVAWGEHLRVWDLLTSEARNVVLKVAVARGMDEGLATRLRDATAAGVERDTFLSDLVNGLRADLRGTDLDSIDFEADPDPDPGRTDPKRAWIIVVAPMINPLLGAGLPVASMELAYERGAWRVEHLIPRAQP